MATRIFSSNTNSYECPAVSTSTFSSSGFGSGIQTVAGLPIEKSHFRWRRLNLPGGFRSACTDVTRASDGAKTFSEGTPDMLFKIRLGSKVESHGFQWSHMFTRKLVLLFPFPSTSEATLFGLRFLFPTSKRFRGLQSARSAGAACKNCPSNETCLATTG